MAGHLLDLHQSLENKAGVEVIDEQSLSVIRVVPRPIGVLTFQDKVQVSFCHLTKSVVRKVFCGLHQQERSISVGINNSHRLLRVRCIGASRCVGGSFKVAIILESVHRCGSHDLKPFILLIYLPDVSERFINIWHCCDERSSFSDRAAYALPIERISPAIVAVARASGAF